MYIPTSLGKGKTSWHMSLKDLKYIQMTIVFFHHK